MTTWLDYDTTARTLNTLANQVAALPKVTTSYDLRVVYYVDESEYDEEGYYYDEFQLNVNILYTSTDCTDFDWSITTDTSSNFTYDILPTAVE